MRNVFRQEWLAATELRHDAPHDNARRRRATGVQPFALRPDPRNANAGTPRGHAFLERSFREYGAGRSAVADATGTLLAGNKAFAAAQALNLPVKIVETTGGEFVVVVRRDRVPVRVWPYALRDACRKAGVPHRLLHECRRTAARNLIRAGVPRVAMMSRDTRPGPYSIGTTSSTNESCSRRASAWLTI
jgi:hypothetical protein